MDLKDYKKVNINKDKSKFIIFIWYVINSIFFNSPFFPFYEFKAILLRLFGAKVGHKLCIKPNVAIKYPWNLKIGDYVSIGEGTWIDNLADISIGSNSCISQGAYLCTGNHDYKSNTFDLILGEITIGEKCWVGAKAIVMPNTVFEDGAVLTASSLGSGVLLSNSVYRGHPAVKIRDRYDA